MRVITAVILSLILSWFVQAQEIDTIRNAIQEQGGGWQAAENAISGLPDDVLRRMMGVILPANMPGYYPGEPSEDLPDEWHWREWVTPVKEQGSCGSCWAFGCVAQLESAIMIVSESSNYQPDLSEQYMVSCDQSNYGCSGGYMSNAYNFLINEGVPDESCFPYQALDLGCEESCVSPFLFSIEAWNSVPVTIKELQEAVYEQPLTCAFYVYRDFTYYQSGVYKHVTGDFLGGHAVCIVGWSVPDYCFIVKNSWGDDWGEDGYFRIDFSEVGGSVDFGVKAGKFELESPAGISNRSLITLWGILKRG